MNTQEYDRLKYILTEMCEKYEKPTYKRYMNIHSVYFSHMASTPNSIPGIATPFFSHNIKTSLDNYFKKQGVMTNISQIIPLFNSETDDSKKTTIITLIKFFESIGITKSRITIEERRKWGFPMVLKSKK